MTTSAAPSSEEAAYYFDIAVADALDTVQGHCGCCDFEVEGIV